MTEGRKAEDLIKECLGEWEMASCDAEGHFEGTLIAWNLAVRLISAKRFGTIMGTELEDSETRKHFMVHYMIENRFWKGWKALAPWISQI